MSNLEEDIKFIEKMIKEYKTFGDLHNPDFEDTDRIYKALENMLKRIKKLEEENETFKNFTSAIFNNNIEKEFIPARKVKNLIKNETINISGFEYIALEDLEELLEEK